MILMGSSISMMERGVLSHKSPLYGRRTGQLLLPPLDFKNARKFFPAKSLKEQVELYSILGGTPAYLLQFSGDRSQLDNVRRNVLRKDAFLYDEVEFVLREELKEPRLYFTILKEIASGRTKVNELSQATGLERNVLSRYLSILENLRIIRRDIPVTEKHPHKSRRGLYKIEDDYFRFWFEFVFPNRSSIEKGEIDSVIAKIERSLNRFVGQAFEDVCRQMLWELLRQKRAPFAFTKVGKWWRREDEIDVVALNDETKEILFAECKWENRKAGPGLVKALMEKAELVDWHNGKRSERFAVFSRSGFTKSCADYCRTNGILTFDLKAIERLLRGR
jgi:AAA+ ATPase superfamily predicted ATPase